MTSTYLSCTMCGGTRGTLKKVEETGLYVHLRGTDCRAARAQRVSDAEKEAILAQARPVRRKKKST